MAAIDDASPILLLLWRVQLTRAGALFHAVWAAGPSVLPPGNRAGRGLSPNESRTMIRNDGPPAAMLWAARPAVLSRTEANDITVTPRTREDLRAAGSQWFGFADERVDSVCRVDLLDRKWHLSWLLAAAAAVPAWSQAAEVQFDMPSVVAATHAERPHEVSLTLRLSAMIAGIEQPPVSQWMVRVLPRDERIQVVDYLPRTETASDVTAPIKVTQTDESTQSAGFTIDGAYAHLARAHVGADRGDKQIDTIQFDRHPVHQAVTAAGTIQRGRGVYFKLRWTATQVLEGEKQFQITLLVPAGWRGGLMDVAVVAYGEDPASTRWSPLPWPQESGAIGDARFVIAAYRQGDEPARRAAYQLSEAERELRRLSMQYPVRHTPKSLPGMIRHVAAKLELEPSPADDSWLPRILFTAADPHLDTSVRKLPMPVRVAILEYAELREELLAMSGGDAQRMVAAKTPLTEH